MEKYFSDRVNLFQNKLLFYYKNSKIKEGLYNELITPVETKKNIFNIALYPGPGLPTFNFSYFFSNRSNGLQKVDIIRDTTMTVNDGLIAEIILTDTLDRRINLLTNQFNIRTTNQFKLWFDQVLNVNILLFDQEDLIANDDRQLPVNFPANASSQSYGINIKSIYNKYK